MPSDVFVPREPLAIATRDRHARPAIASFSAPDSYTSEIGSLALILAMLFCASALVVRVLFHVWTMQRAGDIVVPVRR
jgi:putative ABC transport system permease protein